MPVSKHDFAAFALATLGACTVFSGCSGGHGAGPIASRTVRPVAPSASDWEHQDWVARHGIMTWRVLPSIARTFQAHDGTRWPETTCRTCHGENAGGRGYRMPSTLPALSAFDLATDDAALADTPRARTRRFMREEVVPRMQELLQSSREVTCFTCHPRAGGNRG